MFTKSMAHRMAIGLVVAAALFGVIFIMSDSAQAVIVMPGGTLFGPVMTAPAVPLGVPRSVVVTSSVIAPRPFGAPFFPRFFPGFFGNPFFDVDPLFLGENPLLFNEGIGLGLP